MLILQIVTVNNNVSASFTGCDVSQGEGRSPERNRISERLESKESHDELEEIESSNWYIYRKD